MLASILPGLRGLRAPLAAGSLLLAALYVVAYSRIEPAAGDARLGPGLTSLLHLLGKQARTAILGVAVYLVGTVFVATVRGFFWNVSTRLVPRVATVGYLNGRRTRTMAVVAPFSRPCVRRLLALCEREFNDEALAGVVCSEIVKGGGKRLLVKNKDLYIEWDRLQAEAEFRDAVAGPAVLFVAAAMTAVHWP